MDTRSRDTSPDPIALDSSPPQPRERRPNLRPTPSRSRKTSATPSKSLVFDTPSKLGTTPWQIKVTVEAEPKDGEAGLGVTRTTTIPLRRDGQIDDRRPARKRKGTPARRQSDQSESEYAIDPEDVPRLTSVSPARSARQQLSSRDRRIAQPPPSVRSQRLTIARQELDEALQDVVRFSDGVHFSDTAGDITVSANEDFSIVSLDSLQTARDNSMSNLLQPIMEVDTSHVSAYSTTPKVQYPNIARQAATARASLGSSHHGHHLAASQNRHVEGVFPVGDSIGEESFTVSRERSHDPAQHANDRANHFDVTADFAARNKKRVDSAIDDEDIWGEEASRSLEEDDHDQELLEREQSPPGQFDDLFADQQMKPPRSKIPRTWRRTSGMDFSYVDSPAHVETEQRKLSGGSTDDSGVLTPPSTEDEGSLSRSSNSDSAAPKTIEVTQPDGEGTNMQPDPRSAKQTPVHYTEDAQFDESDGATSPDGEDTGMFFVNNMPKVHRNERARPRPQRQSTIDLAELLNLNKSSPVKQVLAEPQPVRDSQRRQPQTYGREKAQNSLHGGRRPTTSLSRQTLEKSLNTPLRKSLLRSSKVRISPEGQVAKPAPKFQYRRPARLQKKTTDHENSRWKAGGSSQVTDRQPPMSETSNYTCSRKEADHSISTQEDEDGDVVMNDCSREEAVFQEEEEFEQVVEVNYSYEEHLNLDSPAKIQVKFNDNSSQLFSHNRYPSLFDQPDAGPKMQDISTDSAGQDHSQSSTMLVSRPEQLETSEPGLLTRLSTTFWTAVLRPSGPIWVDDSTKPTLSTSSSNLKSTVDPPFPPHLRTSLRNRYGVCNGHFPWTMQHMRTLHRMLNSATTRAARDTRVPRHGPLPAALAVLIDRKHVSVSGHAFTLTAARAHVVAAFMQLLVAPDVIAAMRKGEVAWLGDGLAARCRGYYDPVRHGDDPVWTGDAAARFADGLRGEMGVEFVVRALGDAIWSNECSTRGESSNAMSGV